MEDNTVDVNDFSDLIDVGEIVVGDEDREIIVTDLSQIAALVDESPTDNNKETKETKRPVRKTTIKNKKADDDADYEEEVVEVDSGDVEEEKPKGKKGRKRSKKAVKLVLGYPKSPVKRKRKRSKGRKAKGATVDLDLSGVFSDLSITSSPEKKRGKKSKPTKPAPVKVVQFAVPPSTPTKDENKGRGRKPKPKGVPLASLKRTFLTPIPESYIEDMEPDEIIRPEDLVGFEDIEIYSQEEYAEDIARYEDEAAASFVF